MVLEGRAHFWVTVKSSDCIILVKGGSFLLLSPRD